MVLVSGNFTKFREIQNILVKNLVFSEILKLMLRSHPNKDSWRKLAYKEEVINYLVYQLLFTLATYCFARWSLQKRDQFWDSHPIVAIVCFCNRVLQYMYMRCGFI